MEIQERQAGDVTILEISGRITIGEGDIQLREKIHDIVNRNISKVLLNLGRVSYIDSAGIGELIAAYTAARNRGVQLKLCNLTKKIHDLLTIAQLISVFETYRDENEALASFS